MLPHSPSHISLGLGSIPSRSEKSTDMLEAQVNSLQGAAGMGAGVENGALACLGLPRPHLRGACLHA